MRRLLRFDVLLPLMLLIGVAQYASLAIDAITANEMVLFETDAFLLTSSGPLRYAKDVFVVCFSFAWLLLVPTRSLPNALRKLLNAYFLWIFALVTIGSIGFLLDYSPLFFFPAGMRWLLLLHAGVGIFIFSYTLVDDRHRHRFIFRFLVAVAAVDAYAVFIQFLNVSSLFDVGFGAARLPGLFSHAGVAAFFAIAVALISLHLDGVALKKRIILSAVSMFLALSSGTRFATAAIFLILLSQIFEIAETGDAKLKGKIKFALIPMFLLALFFGYGALIQQVDRGDAFVEQLGKGGRIGNFIDNVEMLYTADLGEILVGRGLGVGTNTAIAANIADGIEPGTYRFNMLADNALTTCFFQFGLLGSLLFWVGLYKFVAFVRPKYSPLAMQRYLTTVIIILVTLFAGSPFEHYFLIIAYAASLGACYWADRLSLAKKLQGQE